VYVYNVMLFFKFFHQEAIIFLFFLVIFICMASFFLYKNANVICKAPVIVIRQLLKVVGLTA